MIKAFKERRPWAVVLINLIFGPFLGMLYLGRGRIAFVYFGLGFVVAALLLFFFPLPISMGSFGIWLLELPIQIVGAAHGSMLARNRDSETALPRYSRWYFLVAIHAASLVTVLIPALIVRTYFYQPFNTVSESMEPTLDAATYFWVSKRAYDEAGPQRGDLVVFYWTDGDYVKRIVAISGDKVQMLGGQLFLNGKIVARHRISDVEMTDEYGIVRPIRQYQETLPSGRSYRTLDLVDNSPQDNTQIFVVPADGYFVLGDNRDNSEGSRLDVGFVARSNVIGKVVVKFADKQHRTMIWAPVQYPAHKTKGRLPGPSRLVPELGRSGRAVLSVVLLAHRYATFARESWGTGMQESDRPASFRVTDCDAA